MIRINLLTVDSARPKRKKRMTIDLAQKVPIACSFILVGTALALGWWYWSLQEESAQLADEVTNAQQETIRLRGLITKVQQGERYRAQLAQRLNLIDTLRRGQAGPVHMLDEVSRSLPEMLWLTSLTQQGNEVSIEGRCVTLTAVSDFMANLQSTQYFKQIELGPTEMESANPGAQGPPVELIKFNFKAQFAPPVR